MRERLPLIYSGDQLVAVGDLWIAADAFSAPGVGVRWRSPIGLIRVDMAFAVSRDSHPFRLHLNIGPEL